MKLHPKESKECARNQSLARGLSGTDTHELPGSKDLCCSLKGNWGEESKEVGFILVLSSDIQLTATHGDGLISIPPPSQSEPKRSFFTNYL